MDKSYLKPVDEPLCPAALSALEQYTLLKIAEHKEAIQELIARLEAEKLYKFFASKFNRTSGFTPAVKNSMLPAVDLSRTWTDTELYDHFKLTQAEIELIERTIK